MSIEEFKNEISEKIDQLNQFDLKKLYPNNPSYAQWNDTTNAEVEKFVKKILSTLKLLKRKLNLLDTAGIVTVKNLDQHLSNLINQLGQLEGIPEETITSQHHSSLESLNHINTILRSSGLHIELTLNPDLKNKLDELNKAEPLLNKFLKGQDSLINAIETASEWLKNKARIDQETIKGQAKAFLDRANEHKLIKKKKKGIPYAGNMWWLVGAFIFSGIVAYLTNGLIDAASDNLNTGSAILRISSLVVPSYLTVFCANQYLYHKRMHETYSYKYAALHTMNNLISTHSEDMQEKIFDKGLTVIFSEPSSRENGGKYDKQLISELLGMLKSQIGGH